MNAVNLLAAAFAVFVAVSPVPIVFPLRFARVLRDVTLAIGIGAALFEVLLFPLSEVSYWISILFLATLAISAPVAGLLENRQSGGQAYRANINGADAPHPSVNRRFALHLVSNTLGLLFTIWVTWFARSLIVTDAAVLAPIVFIDLGLPIAALAVLYFVRGTQLKKCPDLDRSAHLSPGDTSSKERASIEEQLHGYSLAEWHQKLNTVYLALATFLAGASVLIAITSSMISHKLGSSQSVSWQLMLVQVLLLAFVLACGADRTPSVFVTFALGTPATLGVSAWWLTLLEPSTARNLAMGIYLCVGIAAYIGVMMWSRRTRSTIALRPIDIAGPTLLAIALISMLAATYISV